MDGDLNDLLFCGSLFVQDKLRFSGDCAPEGVFRSSAEVWKNALVRCKEYRYLHLREQAFLESFSRAFGEHTLRGFCDLCALYENTFSAWQESAEDKYRNTEKTSVTFAALTAALLFIVMI